MTTRLLAVAAACLVVGGCTATTTGTGGQHAAGTVRSTTPVPATSAATTARTTSAAATAHPAAAIDPCGLLTKAEVDRAAGTTTAAPLRARDTCTYATPTAAKFGQVNVFVGLGAKKIYDIDRTVLDHQFRAVRGIGDEAHLEAGQIFVRVGRTWLALQLARLDDAAQGPLLTELARAAAGRL